MLAAVVQLAQTTGFRNITPASAPPAAGHDDSCTARSATLPTATRSRPVRPWVPMTIRPASSFDCRFHDALEGLAEHDPRSSAG